MKSVFYKEGGVVPNNMGEILRGSIEDVCRDRHLALDIEEITKMFMQSAEFKDLSSAFESNLLEDGTEAYQEAIWACYDFADERL